MMATYIISLLIAYEGQTHTIGENLIAPSAWEVIETVIEEHQFRTNLPFLKQ